MKAPAMAMAVVVASYFSAPRHLWGVSLWGVGWVWRGAYSLANMSSACVRSLEDVSFEVRRRLLDVHERSLWQ